MARTAKRLERRRAQRAWRVPRALLCRPFHANACRALLAPGTISADKDLARFVRRVHLTNILRPLQVPPVCSVPLERTRPPPVRQYVRRVPLAR